MGICGIPDKSRIVLMIANLAAVSVHTSTLLVPKWDVFKTVYFTRVINIQQNLWRVTDISDIILKMTIGIPDETWKKQLILLMTTSLGAGALALIIVILASIIKVKKVAVNVSLITLVVALSSFASWAVVHSALEFKENHLKILSASALDPILSGGIPLNEYVMTTGYFLCIAASGLHALTATVAIGDIIKTIVIGYCKKPVTPVENIESPVEKISVSPVKKIVNKK